VYILVWIKKERIVLHAFVTHFVIKWVVIRFLQNSYQQHEGIAFDVLSFVILVATAAVRSHSNPHCSAFGVSSSISR